MSRGDTRRALASFASGARALLGLRWVRVALVLATLLVVARAGLGLLLGRVVDGLLGRYDLACQWDDLDLALWNGRGELRGLRVAPRGAEDDAPSLLEVEYGVFDLGVLPLLRGALHIGRAEVDGLDLYLSRDGEGQWNLARHFDLAALLEAKAHEPVEDEPASEAGIDLAAPLSISALRLQQARLHLVDELHEPALALVVEGNAGLSYLGDPRRPMRFSGTVTAGDLLDGAHVAGRADLAADALHLDLDAQAGGLHPSVLARYLEPFGIDVACETLGASASAAIDVTVEGETRDRVALSGHVSDVRLWTDGEESLALDRVEFGAPELSERAARLSALRIQGVRGRAARRPDGRLSVAGFDVGPADESAQDPLARSPLFASFVDWFEREEQEAPGWATLLVGGGGDAYPWTLDGIELRGGQLEWTDRSVDPPVVAPLVIERVLVGKLVHDRDQAIPPVSLEVSLSAPGVAQDIRLSGSVDPFAPERSLDLLLDVQGIVLESVQAYLNEAGLEEALAGASFRVGVSGAATTDPGGRTEGWLEVQEVSFEDESELLGVHHVAARGLVYDPEERLLRAGDLEVDGPRLSFARDASSRFVALGLRVLGFGPDEGSAPAPGGAPAQASRGRGGVPSTSATAPGRLPRLEIGRLAWTNSHITFVDRWKDPPERVEVQELGFELTDLVVGGSPDDPVPEPARLVARLVVPDVVGELRLEGSVASRPGAIDLDADLGLTGSGLHGGLLATYLEALGLEPRLEDGELEARLSAGLRVEDGWHLRGALRDTALRDGGVTLASVEELSVDEVVIGAGGTEVGEVALVRPFVRVARHADGALQVAGWRLGTPVQPPARTDAAEAQVAEEPSAPGAEVTPSRAWPALPPARLRALRVEDARLAWSDEAFEPPLDVELRVDGRAASIDTLGGRGTFAWRLSVPEALEVLEAEGSVELGPAGATLDLALAASGVGGGVLARLLPPGMELATEDARLALQLGARAGPAEAGGLGGEVELRDLAWGAEGRDAWLAVDRARLALERADPGPALLAIADLRAEGIELAVERDDTGRTRLLGLVVGASAAPDAPAPDERMSADGPAAAQAPPVAEPAPTGSVTTLPTITLAGDAVVELARVRYRDAALGSDALPVDASARLVLVGPCTLLGPDPTALEPLALRAQATIEGIVRSATVEASAAPFAAQPHVEASLAVEGVRTQGLVERAPIVADLLTGEVEEGVASGTLEARFDVRRARPAELGFGRPFGGEIALADLAYRDAPGGVVLAGFERVAVDIARVDAAKGLVHLREVDVVRPQGRLLRDERGVHILGLVVSTPPEAGEPVAPAAAEAAPVGQPSEHAREVRAVEASAEGAAPDALDLRIDRMSVSGINVAVRDETGAPPVDLPLTELDFELKRLSTRGLREGRPLRFYTYLAASPPADAQADGLPDTPAFAEVVVSGRVALFPEPQGWTQLSLSGLELRHFAGLARQQGLVIEDGALDSSTRVRMQGAQGVDVGTTLVFSDLSLDEPEGGFLERLFSLPVALDTALFVLRNPAGEHRFSVGFTLDEDGLSMASVLRGVTGAMTEIMAGALVGAPLRLIGTVVPGGGEAPLEDWSLAFDPGSTELDPVRRAVLTELGDHLAVRPSLVAVLRHELTQDDLARAERMATPSREACLDLAAGLRRDRQELQRRLEEEIARAGAFQAMGAREAEAATVELRETSADLLGVERALDDVLEILHADSERQRAKRTRVMARRIAELRLAAIAEELSARAAETRAGRVEVRPARVEALDAPGGGRVIVELRRR